MNDRYLFRGKRVDNGEWVYGGIYHQLKDDVKDEKLYIIGGSLNDVGCAYEVIPETVGQCTGLKDKNGKLIFEGDIFKYNPIAINEKITYGVVEYRNTYEEYRGHNPCGYVIHWQDNFTGKTIREDLPFWCGTKTNAEIIGNIHGNPELLEVEE